MSLSLREQLLKAGLVTEKQVAKAEQGQQQARHRQRHEGRRAPSKPPAAEAAAERARAEKAARDLELNRKKQEKLERRARFAAIRQLVEQHQVPRVETEDFYHFLDGRNVRQIAVTPPLRQQLMNGTLGIVRNEGRYAFVPAAVVEQIRGQVERAVIHHNAGTPAPVLADDDPYKNFAVPDDLMW